MYEADGIDLTRTEFDELKFVLAHPDGCSGRVRDRTGADTSLTPAYRRLHELGLLACRIDSFGVVIVCEPERKAADWLASYEKSERDRRWLSRREWGMVAVNLGGGALLGALASIVLRFCFGI